jgi:hypothetical protein
VILESADPRSGPNVVASTTAHPSAKRPDHPTAADDVKACLTKPIGLLDLTTQSSSNVTVFSKASIKAFFIVPRHAVVRRSGFAQKVRVRRCCCTNADPLFSLDECHISRESRVVPQQPNLRRRLTIVPGSACLAGARRVVKGYEELLQALDHHMVCLASLLF